ncbi:hypothetical protein H4582DRAFT_1440736 [Lactarius indigo]|nr:hypothetical protein H4582DRAFT_1440736 [Lactarius indigo]
MSCVRPWVRSWQETDEGTHFNTASRHPPSFPTLPPTPPNTSGLLGHTLTSYLGSVTCTTDTPCHQLPMHSLPFWALPVSHRHPQHHPLTPHPCSISDSASNNPIPPPIQSLPLTAFVQFKLPQSPLSPSQEVANPSWGPGAGFLADGCNTNLVETWDWAPKEYHDK